MRLIVSYTVVKRVCPVLCFKPFKIPFSVSCGLYRDNDRNKKTDLSCCKIQPTEIPRFRCPLQTAPVRTEGLFWRPHGCNIAAGTAPVPEAVAEVFQSFQKKFFRRGFLLSPDNSELYLCMPKIFSAYERSSLCEAGRSPESNAFLTDIMNTDPKQTNRNARKSETPSYKYSFWFNEEHIRFKKLLCKSGLEHNRSQFIVKRIFGEEFVVIKRDPSKTQFIARLNDFYFQFQKLGNNYNQIVKAVNSHFSNVAIPHQIAMLEQRTRELKALSIEILNLAKRAAEWLRI